MAFPQTLDSFINPTPSTPTNSPVTPLSGQLSQLNNAVEAIEGVIGVTGSTVPTSLEYRLEDVQAVASVAAADIDAHASAENPHSQYLSESAMVRTYPASVVSDLTGASWARVDGGAGGGTVTTSPVAGFDARLTTNNGVTAYVVARKAITPVLIGANDVITFEVNVPDASTTRAITFRLLVNTSGKQFSTTGFEMWHAGRNTASFKLSDMTAAGGALTTDQIEYIQVDLTGPAYTKTLEIDVGRCWIGGAARVPLCLITFDSNYEKVYDWAWKYMRPHGLPGNVYVRGSDVGLSGYMTLAELQEVRAAGWGIGLYGYIAGLGANSHNFASVAAAQSVGAGASFTINGTMAAAGVATLDVPRYVTVYATAGNESSNSFLITGTDATGAAYSEHVRGPSSESSRVTTQGKFKTVTSVVSRVSTTNPVSIGTGFNADTYIETTNQGQAWLQANGFPRAYDWAHPYGESNNDTVGWLAAQGFLTARTVSIGATIFHDAAPGCDPNLYFLPCATEFGGSSSAASIKTMIDNSYTRGFDFCLLGHLNNTLPPSEADLKATVAYLAQLHRQGLIRVVSFDEFRELRGIVAA